MSSTVWRRVGIPCGLIAFLVALVIIVWISRSRDGAGLPVVSIKQDAGPPKLDDYSQVEARLPTEANEVGSNAEASDLGVLLLGNLTVGSKSSALSGGEARLWSLDGSLPVVVSPVKEGKFCFPGLSPGHYTMVVDCPAFSSVIELFTIPADATVVSVDIISQELWVPMRVTTPDGQIVTYLNQLDVIASPSGVPSIDDPLRVPSSLLLSHRSGPDNARGEAEGVSAFCRDDVRFIGLAYGSAVLAHGEVLNGTVSMEVPSTIPAELLGGLDFRIVDASGSRVESAKSSWVSGDSIRNLMFDTEGWVRIDGIPSGRGVLTIDAPGFAVEQRVIDIPVGTVARLGEIALGGPLSCTISVRDDDGVPVSGKWVFWEPLEILVPSAIRHLNRAGKTDGFGIALAERLGSGQYLFTCHLRKGSERVALPTLGVAGRLVELVLKKPGYVVVARPPSMGRRDHVTIEPKGEPGRVVVSESFETLRTRVALPPGEYVVRFRDRYSAFEASSAVTVNAGRVSVVVPGPPFDFGAPEVLWSEVPDSEKTAFTTTDVVVHGSLDSSQFAGRFHTVLFTQVGEKRWKSRRRATFHGSTFAVSGLRSGKCEVLLVGEAETVALALEIPERRVVRHDLIVPDRTTRKLQVEVNVGRRRLSLDSWRRTADGERGWYLAGTKVPLGLGRLPESIQEMTRFEKTPEGVHLFAGEGEGFYANLIYERRVVFQRWVEPKAPRLELEFVDPPANLK